MYKMAASYTYSITTHFLNATDVVLEDLQGEIAIGVTPADYIDRNEDIVTIYFTLALDGVQETALIAIVNNYTFELPIEDNNTGVNTVQTITNKTITDPESDLIARALWNDSGSNSVSTYAATIPTAGQILTATNSFTATWQDAATGQLPEAFSAISTTTVDIAGSFGDTFDIALEQENKKTSGFTHLGTSSDVTVNTAGTYVISGVFSIQSTGGENSHTSGALYVDTGSGFNLVPGSTVYVTKNINSENTSASFTIILDVAAGDVFKLVVTLLNITANIFLRPNCGLTIFTVGNEGPQGQAGVGSTISIQDESISVTGGPHSTLNFVGNGLEAKNAGGGIADVILDETELVVGKLKTTSGSVDISGSAPPMLGQVLSALSSTTGEWKSLEQNFDAIVALSGGDYNLPSLAFSSGATTILIKNGTYNEMVDINVPDEGVMVGESTSGTIINMTGTTQISTPTPLRSSYTGTINCTTDSAVVTGTGTLFQSELEPGDYILLGDAHMEILSISGQLSLTLTRTWRGAPITAQGMSGQTMSKYVRYENFTVTGDSTSTLMQNTSILNGIMKGVAASNGINATHIEFLDCSNCNINNVDSFSSGGAGIKMVNSKNMIVKDARCFHNNNIGIHMVGDGSLSDGKCSGLLLDGGIFSYNDAVIALDIGSGITVEPINGGFIDSIKIVTCLVLGNAKKGIDVFDGSNNVLIDGCTVKNNAVDGIDYDGVDNIISNCIVNNNGRYGIRGGNDGVITGNECSHNAVDGISLEVDQRCSVTGNVCRGNGGYGISGSGAEFSDNIIDGNFCDTNTLSGINIGGPSNIISNNVCISNTEHGLQISDAGGDSNLITNNTFRLNTLNGINIITGANNNIIRNNIVTDNTGAQIIDNGTGSSIIQHTSETVSPGLSDDITIGYGVGSTWVNTVADSMYMCVDGSVGAAVWTQTSSSLSAPGSSLDKEIVVFNGTGGNVLIGSGRRDYGASATDPLVPTPQAGDKYYNTDINQEMVFDGTRGKWLSVCTLYEGFGRNTTVAPGVFYRRFNGMITTDSTGVLVPKGTITRMSFLQSTGTTHTFEVRVGFSAVSTISGTGQLSDNTLDVDFDAGNMRALNSIGSADTTTNLQAVIYYKLRA